MAVPRAWPSLAATQASWGDLMALTDAPHGPLWTHAAEVNEALLAFLAK
ncbi:MULTISPECIES: hypothetical protein [Kitasatospora]|uniref:Alpha/beta hydrolase n=1 Tax=Kitasatospora cathayae TaxID=3004092 RepID=A0ABY7QH51_9ACTN|nr:hypothetical protein [Kitasatospora sp. HUAS 3-15]WBP91912.1 hypothetical protein O1G21_10695 [Kitasatospora sp. HUAS 3-15]